MQAPVLNRQSWHTTASRLTYSSRRSVSRCLARAQKESNLRLVGRNREHSLAPGQEVLIGVDPECDIQVNCASGGQVCRASVSFRTGRAYAKAVPDKPPADDEMDLIAPATGVFIDERELRPGVDYLVSPGAQLKFGKSSDDQETLRVEFDEPETGSAAGLDMVMKAMARTPEVREKLA